MRKNIILAASALALTAGSLFALGNTAEQPVMKAASEQCPPECCNGDNEGCGPNDCQKDNGQCCEQ